MTCIYLTVCSRMWNHVAYAYDAISYAALCTRKSLRADTNLATWLLSMVVGCIQPTLSSFSGEVTLCSCMDVSKNWDLNGQDLPCVPVPSATNIFTRERCDLSFTVRVMVDLALCSLLYRSFGFKAGRGHKSQVSLLSWRVCELFNSQRTPESVVIKPPEGIMNRMQNLIYLQWRVHRPTKSAAAIV